MARPVVSYRLLHENLVAGRKAVIGITALLYIY